MAAIAVLCGIMKPTPTSPDHMVIGFSLCATEGTDTNAVATSMHKRKSVDKDAVRCMIEQFLKTNSHSGFFNAFKP
jgi:hypothetical protein